MPLVSILIPCYNAGKYIAETLQSVINQTYTNWECIIVDDHSTDNSVETITAFTVKYPNKIKLINNPRKGACAARNVAFENSKGEYIQYLDADDLLSPDKINSQINESFLNLEIKLFFGRWYFFNNCKSKVRKEKYPIFCNFNSTVELLLTMWESNSFLSSAVYLTHRSIHTNIFWDERILRNQDGEFFARILLSTQKIKYTKNAICYYRIGNPSSITATATHDKILSAYNTYLSYKKHILPIKNTKRVREALAKHFSGLIYRHYYRFPDISQLAIEELEKLGVKPKASVGGFNFRLLANIIGFYNTIKLSHYLKNIIKNQFIYCRF